MAAMRANARLRPKCRNAMHTPRMLRTTVAEIISAVMALNINV